MKSSIIFTLLVLSYLTPKAQDTAVLRRTPYVLTMMVDDNTTYEENIKAIPYLYPNRSMQLYPGETVYLEIELKDTVIISMKAVREIMKPASTLTLKFEQTAKKNVHESMMLTIVNPFPFQLKYEAMIFLFSKKDWVPTTVIPVMAGLSSFELWPDLITSIALGDWKFESAK